jgi:general secretion pathway protein A
VYLDFFNLREQPFNLTPDPRFLFLSPQHEEALSNLLYGIQERKGFIEVTGEVGTGKTSLCRTLLDRLDETVSTALVFNSYLNEIELLQAITSDFGIVCHDTTRKGYIDALNRYLLHEFSAGRNAMVLVDEAQNLEPRVLEQLRMLSNLETERGKLVQVVLVGQPELRDKLATPQMRQLDQRIAVRFHLRGLTRTETQQYIMHRLTVAGNGNAITFTPSALTSLHRHCAGIPRRINLLCDRLLVSAYVQDTTRITARLVRQSLRDLGGSWHRAAARPGRWWSALAGATIGVCATLGVLGAFLGYWPLSPDPRRVDAPRPERVAVLRQPTLSHVSAVRSPAPPQGHGSTSAPPPPEPAQRRVAPSPPKAATVPQISEHSLELAASLWRIKTRAEALHASAQANGQTDWERFLAPAAKIAGLAIIPIEAILPQLTRLSHPCFIEVVPDPATSRAVLWVITKGYADRVLVYRESAGLTSIPLQELRRMWYGKLYLTLTQEIYDAPLLAQGMSGARVQALQQALHDLGYLTGNLTGHFDAQTLQAVKGFQRDNLLVVDGYVGRRTLTMLLHFGGQSIADTT